MYTQDSLANQHIEPTVRNFIEEKRVEEWDKDKYYLKIFLTLNEKEKELKTQTENQCVKETAEPRSIKLCRNIIEYFREYCTNSTLHGIKYLGERRRTITERVWWFIICLASLLMCSRLIMETWNKWNTTPVIVSFEQTPTQIWQIPFPAVTICTETKARASVYNFTEAYIKYLSEDMTPEEFDLFEDVSQLCDSQLYEKMGGKNTSNSVIDFINEVAPPFEEMIWICRWTNLNLTCEDMFEPILTKEGLCYTFNMLDSLKFKKVYDYYYIDNWMEKDWSVFEGYNKGAEEDVYPRRTLDAGIGLTVVLRDYDFDLDYICKGPLQGFKIWLHNPEEIPQLTQNYIRIPLNQDVNVQVLPEMMTSSEALKNYHPSHKHCFFPNDKKLWFYKVYTQQNCEVESLANFTLETCGCVGFYMPRASNAPICGIGKYHCMEVAKCMLNYWQRKLPKAAAQCGGFFVEREMTKEVLKERIKNMKKYNCLPACSSLKYGFEISKNDLHWKKMFGAFQANTSELPGIQISRVKIFFKDAEFIASRRSELYGPIDFLSSCGGLLGLFMGFSFLSLVEIIYFLTLRIWCNIKMSGKN